MSAQPRASSQRQAIGHDRRSASLQTATPGIAFATEPDDSATPAIIIRTFEMSRHDLPRSSTETEQRHLLAVSETASLVTDGDRTPRAGSPNRAAVQRHQSIATPQGASTQGSYRGFSSETAYLAALRTWAEGRAYTEPTETTLFGYYGSTTMAEYASRPPVLQPLGLRKKWKAMKTSRQEKKKNDERRATIA